MKNYFSLLLLFILACSCNQSTSDIVDEELVTSILQVNTGVLLYATQAASNNLVSLNLGSEKEEKYELIISEFIAKTYRQKMRALLSTLDLSISQKKELTNCIRNTSDRSSTCKSQLEELSKPVEAMIKGMSKELNSHIIPHLS